MEERLFPKSREEIIDTEMKKLKLPSFGKFLIESVLDGRIKEESLICCHSDCSLCNEKVSQCLSEIKKQLNEK
ncbi:MAG TPA: hypothetical protein PK453_25330 [Leptospiraceae bacterium]|nr:hypothetical protein [Leptospiraceae bacterium]HMY65626.1 hypothetical protein [Leptospiraceae bacterium]HNF17003.1 hypothetical protein [Leptospiraceae bacterium]HNF23865.1 hypothetical protein [Leptospiraceae bacterium]HNI27355.1 hypothetical protein [Leptospiraceae bacterium]